MQKVIEVTYVVPQAPTTAYPAQQTTRGVLAVDKIVDARFGGDKVTIVSLSNGEERKVQDRLEAFWAKWESALG